MPTMFQALQEIMESHPGEQFSLKGNSRAVTIRFSDNAYLVEADGTVIQDSAFRRTFLGLKGRDLLEETLAEKKVASVDKLDVDTLYSLSTTYKEDSPQYAEIKAALEKKSKEFEEVEDLLK